MPRKKKPTKLDVLKFRIAEARCIIDMQQALLEKLRRNGEPTDEAKFKNEAGFGFIELDDDSRTDIFVHVRDCEHEVPLAVGDRVSFVRKMQSDGRVRARKVRVEG
jgi:cold shock CspA family protein